MNILALSVLASCLFSVHALPTDITAPPTGLPGYACSVPSGSTYITVEYVQDLCGPGLQPYYQVVEPEDNLWACLQVDGFVYDKVQASTACALSGTAIQYRLRVPVDLLWSCGPGTYNGFVYDDVYEGGYCSLDDAGLEGRDLFYRIRKPVDGLASCAQIIGFVYTEVWNSLACGLGGSFTMYTLKKPVDGLWACGPGTYNGYSYDDVVMSTNCVFGEESPYYHLREPVPGVWVCNPPSGFPYSQERTVDNTCEVGYEGTQYLLS
jgi:hypothetical protein